MTCGHVTRLLADKNHVSMEPHWALVEQLPDYDMGTFLFYIYQLLANASNRPNSGQLLNSICLFVERLFEDHELLVDNLMNWKSDSKNRVLFVQHPDKISLFNTPEQYLPGTQMAPGSDHDEHTR